jgi:hypothetical protein
MSGRTLWEVLLAWEWAGSVRLLQSPGEALLGRSGAGWSGLVYRGLPLRVVWATYSWSLWGSDQVLEPQVPE